MSKHNKDLKIGDIISAYHSGYHKISKIEPRFYKEGDGYTARDPNIIGQEYNSLIHYVKVMDGSLKPLKGKREACCDAAYCVKLTVAQIEEIQNKEIDRIKLGYDALIKIVKGS